MPTNHDLPFTRIAMLSTHGYVDPIPQLGRTDTGGQVVYVLKLAEALSRLGIKVDIFTRWFDRSLPQIDTFPQNSAVRVIRIQAGPWEFIPKETIYHVLPELNANLTAFIQANELDYDLFHGHYVDAGIVTLSVAEHFKKPSFFTAHSIGAWKKEQMGGESELMEAKFNFALRIKEELQIFATVNAQSMTTDLQKEKLQELYGFTADNIAVIPPGTDIHLFRPRGPGEEKTKTTLPDKYIFCLSRIDTNKGHDLLLNAFSIVAKKNPGIHLVIGGGSPHPEAREQGALDNMNTIIQAKKIQDRVSLIGYVPDELMAPYYRQAEIFVLPSLFEPFGMTATEAMACGVPVVASQFGGIQNVIASGQNGLLVDPADPQAFAAAILELLEQPEKATELGRAGYKTVKQHYSWEAIAAKHISFYLKFI